MALPSDWYIDKGEAGQSISQQHQFAQDTARLMIELMRLLRKQAAVAAPVQGELLDPEMSSVLDATWPSEMIEAQVLYEQPELSGVAIPLIEPEIIPDQPILPSLQHRPEQVAADTAQMLVEQLGDHGIYQAEGYTIKREERPVAIVIADGTTNLQADEIIYRLWDKADNEILQFRDAGRDRGYDILKNEMLPEDLSAILKARLGIETEQGLGNIIADPTFDKQVNALGDMAPAGSQAANFANYAMNGYEANTLTTPKYKIGRDQQGNVTIHKNPLIEPKIAHRVRTKSAYTAGTPATAETIHNPSGQVLLRTEGGRVAVFNMGGRDRQNFAQLFSAAQDKPLNSIATPPTKSARPVIGRD
jgi:hypothetical protein